MGSGLFPADFAGPLFQRDDELKIDAVAGQQQEVVMEDGGTGTTLNYVVFELGVLPVTIFPFRFRQTVPRGPKCT